ncbi:MAG: GatB/YqeY domain-containing protein [Gemmatimonadales bacterium]
MPELAGTLQGALNAARKAQDKARVLLLSTIVAGVKNREIELKRTVTDDDVVEVLRKGIKTRQDSVEQYEKAGRMELAARETAQIGMLEEFLPPSVDPAEIRAAAREAIAGGAKDVGALMKVLMPKFKGRADGKVINQVAREELQAG